VPAISRAGLADTLLQDFFTWGFRIIAYIFNFLGGILFTLGGMLTNLMLDLNLNVLNDSNSLVHVGWRIVRDIANLGFVLVIIVIAFATILRFEQYGVSKLLPKLIAAAIIVNFSFVIATVFINFSHVLTNFFAARALPEKTVSGLSGWDLSTSLSDAFGPQRFYIETDPLPPNPEEEVGGLTGFSTAVLTSIAGLIFTVVFTLIGALVLLAFAFMLLMRYLWLTFLVILAPLIWLFWVIPALQGQFSKWWNKFLQWVFFAPASMFFVYLALVSVKSLGSTNLAFLENSNTFAGVIKNTMIQGAQMVVLAGILIGGLIIAQKMGITGAAGAMGIASKAGGIAKGWVGRQAIKAGSLPARTKWGRGLTEGIQKTGANLTRTGTSMGRLGKFVTAPIRGVGKGLGLAGAGLSTAGIVQGENLVKQAEDGQKGLSDKQLALRIGAMGDDERVAALMRLAKNKNLEMVPEMARYISDSKTKAIFESYGKGKEYSDLLEKTAGFNTAMLTGKDEKGSPISLEEATKKFRESYSIKDYDKLQPNVLSAFDAKKNNLGLDATKHEKIRNAVRQSIFETHPGAISKVRTKMKGDDLRSFQKELDDYIETFEKSNLPEEFKNEKGEKVKLRGLTVPVKVKLDWIDKNRPDSGNWARGIYNSRKNFGSTLFGGFAPMAAEEGEAPATT